MDDDILQTMAQHDHYKDTGEEESYKVARNGTVYMIHQEITIMSTTHIEPNQSSSLWSYGLRSLLKTVSMMVTKITNPQDVARSFNDVFMLIVNTYVPSDYKPSVDYSQYSHI